MSGQSTVLDTLALTEDRKVVVSIDPIGMVKVEAMGFNGEGCADATKPLEDALASGAGGMTKEMKPEWYASDEAGVEQDQGVEW